MIDLLQNLFLLYTGFFEYIGVSTCILVVGLVCLCDVLVKNLPKAIEKKPNKFTQLLLTPIGQRGDAT